MKISAIIPFLILIFLFAAESRAGTFEVLNRNSKVYQGDVLMVKVAPDLRGKDIRLFAFDELYQFNKDGYAFIGLEVDHKPGNYILYLVEAGEGHIQYDFYYTHVEVLEKQFGNPWYAGPAGKPDKAVQKQRQKETLIKDAAYALANIEDDYTRGPFVRPLENLEETDSFGILRLYGSRNRKTKTIKIEKKVPHGGVDLRARTPLPVLAVNSGKVLLARNFPLRNTEGNMLIIDHGSGVLSLYLHLSKFGVKKGDFVTKGQIVAMTGATPRGTPPHLHFMVKINGTNVDPISFINDFNRYMDR